MSARQAVDGPGACVRVGAGEDAYLVRVGAGLLRDVPSLLEGLGPHRLAVISDANVAPLHAEPLVSRCRDAGYETALLTFPAGEASKTRKSWSILTDELIDAGVGRDGCVVAVGGGVTTDLAGFVAATYLRGIALVQVPTSYLAMLDASVGGKTGVDARGGKNMVGAFHAPELVVVDTDTLESLPARERAEGLVEAFKHGATLDEAYFERLVDAMDALLAAEPEAAGTAVLRSVELKAAVVTEDERESAYRQVLNFGHTVGHALESASDFAIGHGSAVAFGMVVEAVVGESLGVTETGTADRIRSALEPLVGPLRTEVDPDRVVARLGSDKKNRAGRIRCVLLERLGRVAAGRGWTHEVTEAIVVEALEAVAAEPPRTS